MSERRTHELSRELRATAPPAPQRLRENVHEISARDATRQRRPLYRALAIAAVAGLIVLTAAAALSRRDDDSPSSLGAPTTAEGRELRIPKPARDVGGDVRASTESRAGKTLSAQRPFSDVVGGAATLPPAKRFQDYRVSMRLHVDGTDDLSAKAQQAMRDTRRMGGFVGAVDFATEGDGGTASLVLRVPVTKIQEAVARFSELGTIQAQQVMIEDLQPQADRLATRISRLRAAIAELEAKQRRVGLSPSEQFQLESLRQQLQTATQQRRAVVRQASYATVALDLTTRKEAQKEEPGAFRTFWDDASKILTTELVWLLYALVVAGPFLLLALAAVLAERSRRRRSADALLAHH